MKIGKENEREEKKATNHMKIDKEEREGGKKKGLCACGSRKEKLERSDIVKRGRRKTKEVNVNVKRERNHGGRTEDGKAETCERGGKVCLHVERDGEGKEW